MDFVNFAITETYIDVESLITETVARFARVHGGDVDDMRADADTFFLKAYSGYIRNKGSFRNRVRYVVWMGLMEGLRLRSGRNARLPRAAIPLQRLPTKEHFDAARFCAELSADASFVARLTLSWKGIPTREHIEAWLTERGWQGERITNTFEEIGEAL